MSEETAKYKVLKTTALTPPFFGKLLAICAVYKKSSALAHKPANFIGEAMVLFEKDGARQLLSQQVMAPEVPLFYDAIKNRDPLEFGLNAAEGLATAMIADQLRAIWAEKGAAVVFEPPFYLTEAGPSHLAAVWVAGQWHEELTAIQRGTGCSALSADLLPVVRYDLAKVKADWDIGGSD